LRKLRMDGILSTEPEIER